MESEARVSEQLSHVDRARRRAEVMPSRRAMALLDIGESGGFALYAVGFLLAVNAPDGTDRTPVGLLLIPLALYGSLSVGALARYGLRRRFDSGTGWWGIALRIVVVVAAFVALFLHAPLWVPLFVLLVGLGLLALPPVIVCVRTRESAASDRSAPGIRRPLRPAVRVTTSLLGVVAAVGVIAAPSPEASLTFMVLAFLPVFVASIAQGSAWGLSGVGAAWGRAQWAAFAVITAVQFGVALWATYASPPAAAMIVIAVVLVATMTTVAWLPGAREHGDA